MQVVWFKRDLRVADHRALAQAAACGPVLPLYVAEPELWSEPDMSERQWAFIADCLAELRDDLARIGQPLIIRFGDMLEVLSHLHAETPITALWSHEETGTRWTFDRDRRVAAWCRAQGLPWHEVQNFGVARGPSDRNGWAKRWDQLMGEGLTLPPTLAPLDIAPGQIPDATVLGLSPDPCPDRQRGGRRAAQERLESFLTTRGQPYRKAMSSPLAGAEACSRISPHLAYGTLSMREAAQATWTRQREEKLKGSRTGWRGSLSSFSGRLHWHCHFIQKLEDEPRLEFQNLHPAYDGMRPSSPDRERLAAWENGETGLPFLDACMRSLRATGWLNFRMRAMVTAVASYHLWLPWRDSGLALARLFTDYEPGIHWPQVQMQSGTTGINTIRIYNPVKQGLDQDPTGAFTRRWVPELADVPDKVLQEPWTWDGAGRVLGRAYPHPIIDPVSAAREARDKVWAVRKGSAFRQTASAIQAKHGSRKSGIPNRGQRRASAAAQLSLPLE